MLKIFSLKHKTSLLFATLILILNLGYLIIIRTYQNQLTTQIKNLETLTTKINFLYDSWLKYMLEKPGFDLLEKQHAETIEQFFPPFTLADIIAALSQVAAQSRVILTSIKPEVTKQKNMLQAFPVDIALSGRYQQIINFINLIVGHGYFMLFDKIIMQAEANSLTIQATLQTIQLVTENQTAITDLKYSQQSGIPARRLGASGKSVFGSYKDSHELDANNGGTNSSGTNLNSSVFCEKPEGCEAGTRSINLSAKSIAKLRDPFNDESSTLKVADITRWPSSSLTFLGVYKIANNNWAIVTDPNGFTYQVTVGDHIGSMQSAIIAINKNAILTTNAIDNVYREG